MEWVKLRSKINGTFSIEGKKGVAFEGLAEYGAWSLAFHPICNGTHLDQFARIQTGIMPDQLSTDREGKYLGRRKKNEDFGEKDITKTRKI